MGTACIQSAHITQDMVSDSQRYSCYSVACHAQSFSRIPRINNGQHEASERFSLGCILRREG